MAIDHLKCCQKPLAALSIERLNPIAQTPDRPGQVGPFRAHGVEARGIFDTFLFGPQIDRADLIALAFERHQVGLDAAGVGGHSGGLLGDAATQLVWLDADRVTDGLSHLGETLAGGVKACGQGGAKLARLGCPLFRGPLLTVGLDSQIVGMGHRLTGAVTACFSDAIFIQQLELALF